jgi:TatD DNase family protein
MEIIDSHCHLFLDDFKDDFRDTVFRAGKAGLSRIINVGLDVQSSQQAIKQAQSTPGLHPTVGWHPHGAKLLLDANIPDLIDLALKHEVVAFGEIGLDFFHNFSPPDTQKKVFHQLLLAAIAIGKPVIIHCRDAWEDFFNILTPLRNKLNGVLLHCFSGTEEIVKKSLDLGCHLSFSGSVTYPKAEKLRQAITLTIPRERILIETDAPYLAPGLHRSHRNEPAYIAYHILPIVAQCLQMTLWEAAELTSSNAISFFSLSGDTLGSL